MLGDAGSETLSISHWHSLLKSLITDDVWGAHVVGHLFARITKLGPEAYDAREARAVLPTVQWVLVNSDYRLSRAPGS